MQWQNNRDLRINRRASEICEAVAISAKIFSLNQSEKKETALDTKTATEIIEKTSVDEKVGFLMRNIRQANEEWMHAKDIQAAPLPAQTERLMQFFIERDLTTAPSLKTIETASFIANRYGIESPEFTNELNAKVWVITRLPETGKQLFLENYIEQIQGDSLQMLVDMQKIQLKETMQIIYRQSEDWHQQRNQFQLNQTEIDKIWQTLQQAGNTPVNAQMTETVRQFQADSGKEEIITPISKLDAIHTTLSKTNSSIREANASAVIEKIRNEVRQNEVKQLEAEIDTELNEIKQSETKSEKVQILTMW